jgi:GNAT superfamily N-acetyltransferase
MEMNFRMATESELPNLAELRWNFRSEEHTPPEGMTREIFLPVCLDFLRQAYASGRWAMWVAAENGAIIATLYVQRILKIPNPRSLTPEFGYITSVYTVPVWRNQGVGAELMRRVQAWGLQEGLEMFVLWPSERSGRFYQRAGFVPSPEALEYYMNEP